MNIGDKHISLFSVFLAIIGTIASIYVAYDIYIRQATTKGDLLIEEVARYSLSLSSVAGKEMQYYIDGKMYKDLISSVFYIRNNGNTPIEPRDYFKELTLFVGDDLNIIDVAVTTTIPRDLNVRWTEISNKSYLMDPVLLNQGDMVAIKILLKPVGDGKYENYIDKDVVSWSARIKNVPNISVKNVYEGVLLKSYLVPDAFTLNDLIEGGGFVIELNYISLPLFILLSIALSLVGLLFIIKNINLKTRILIIINVFLSISTSEIACFYIFGSMFSRTGDYIINAPLVAIHLLFLIYIYLSNRRTLTNP